LGYYLTGSRDEGMVDEVKNLMEQGLKSDILIYYGLEYKYITLYLTGKMTYEAMVIDLETAIHQFAKRQMTWFRGMERRGVRINWLDGNLPFEAKINRVMELLCYFR
jgi:tRNA dimethylallyltransferase